MNGSAPRPRSPQNLDPLLIPTLWKPKNEPPHIGGFKGKQATAARPQNSNFQSRLRGRRRHPLCISSDDTSSCHDILEVTHTLWLLERTHAIFVVSSHEICVSSSMSTSLFLWKLQRLYSIFLWSYERRPYHNIFEVTHTLCLLGRNHTLTDFGSMLTCLFLRKSQGLYSFLT